LIRAQKRILDHIPGIFRIVQETIYGVVEPILVAMYQFAKGLGPAFQTVPYQPVVIVTHGSLLGFGRWL
jgi:hypothetical protein